MSDSNTSIDYGPLTGLIGSWKGDKGMDIAPTPDDVQTSLYYETLSFEAIGDVTNAGTQTLAVLHYQQIVKRKVDDAVFHHETGYWMWDASSATVMNSLTIPRAVAVLAGGRYSASDQNQPPHGASQNADETMRSEVFTPEVTASEVITLEVKAAIDDPDWSIVQSPFMRDNAKTVAFAHKISVGGDSLSYSETTTLDIYGRIFEHTDKNELVRA